MTQEAFGIVLGAIVVIVVTLGAFVGLVYLACLAALRHHAREHMSELDTVWKRRYMEVADAVQGLTPDGSHTATPPALDTPEP